MSKTGQMHVSARHLARAINHAADLVGINDLPPYAVAATTNDIDPVLALRANLIDLIDRVDMLTTPYYAEDRQLQHAPSIRKRLRRYAGDFFAPELLEAFLDVSATEAFWLLLTPENVSEYIHEMAGNGDPGTLDPVNFAISP